MLLAPDDSVKSPCKTDFVRSKSDNSVRAWSKANMRSILPTGKADSNNKLFFLFHKKLPAEPGAVPCLGSPRIVNFELEHLLMELLDGLRFLSPHPGPLPGERENRPPSLRHTRDEVWLGSVRKARASRSCSLSPRERVRVRGNDGSTANECRVSKGLLSSEVGQRNRTCVHGVKYAKCTSTPKLRQLTGVRRREQPI